MWNFWSTAISFGWWIFFKAKQSLFWHHIFEVHESDFAESHVRQSFLLNGNAKKFEKISREIGFYSCWSTQNQIISFYFQWNWFINQMNISYLALISHISIEIVVDFLRIFFFFLRQKFFAPKFKFKNSFFFSFPFFLLKKSKHKRIKWFDFQFIFDQKREINLHLEKLFGFCKKVWEKMPFLNCFKSWI